MKNLILLLLVSATFSACSKNRETVTPAADQPVSLAAQNLTDVVYGSDPAQKLDLSLPANRSADSTPLIVLIHGGAWTSGDKSDFNTYVSMVKERLPKYAVANINYRLATQNGNAFPTQEHDVLKAIQFLKEKRASYAISGKLVLLGASAGAHLALLQAYKYAGTWKPVAAISFFGPTDMTSLYNSQTSTLNQYGMQMLLGGTPAMVPQSYQQSSPLQFAGAESCATLLLHGGADPLVPATQSTSLKSKLEANAVPVQYIYYPTEGHGWTGTNLNHSFDAVASFLTQQVH